MISDEIKFDAKYLNAQMNLELCRLEFKSNLIIITEIEKLITFWKYK